MEQTKEFPTYYNHYHCNWGNGKNIWTDRGVFKLSSSTPSMDHDVYIIPDIKPVL